MRKSNAFLAVAALGICLLCLAFAHSALRSRMDRPALLRRARLVAELGLTDLCLCPEARYTRHPSQADLHAPFQDHPMSMEHFPAGSIIGPPPGLGGINGGLGR